MRLFEVITTPILYHYTSAFSVVQMLTEGKIALTVATGSDIQPKSSQTYFLSTTRSRVGDYSVVHKAGTTGVVLVLDRNWLNRHMQIKPVDYWGTELRKIQPSKFEMEDRVFSHSPYIVLPKSPTELIKEMHMLVKLDTDERYREILLKIITLSKRQGIPLFIYQDGNAWLLQDKRRAVPQSTIIQQARQLPQRDNYRSQYKTSSYFGSYMELFQVSVEARDRLSARAKSTIRSLDPYYLVDGYRKIEADIHNARSPNSPAYPQLVRFIDFLHANKLTPRGLIDYLSNKWWS
jgi:hypothetical protein